MTVVVDFCGESHSVLAPGPFAVGRDADLSIDDNPFLHRRFLSLYLESDLWWLENVGGQLSATLSDPAGLLQAWLAPGAKLPLTLPRSIVAFSAGSTSYELEVLWEDAPFVESFPVSSLEGSAETTIGRVSLTPDQLLLVLVLAESRLRAEARGPTVLPSAPEAAQRLGWSVTKFNRKLDNVCAKLSGIGVRGLHGDPQRLAANRRARLVEYAVGARVVTSRDLALLSDERGGRPVV